MTTPVHLAFPSRSSAVCTSRAIQASMSQISAGVTRPDHIPPVRTRPVIHATPGVPLTHVLQPHENPTPVRILRRTPVRPPRRDRVRGRHRSRRRDARLPGRGVFATCATPSHRTSTTRLSGNTAPRTSSPQWDKRSCCIRGSSGHNESHAGTHCACATSNVTTVTRGVDNGATSGFATSY